MRDRFQARKCNLRVLSVSIFIALLFTGAPWHASQAQTRDASLPEGFTLVTLADALNMPMAIEFMPNGKMLIAERTGVVKEFDEVTKATRVILDLSNDVNDAGERGLMDMVLDPDFAVNNAFYLLYTYDKPGDERDGVRPSTGKLTRFVMKDGVADPASAFVLLDGYQSDLPYHAPGGMRFAKDGTLFVAFGDSSDPYGANDLALRAQSLDLMHGKILRINRDGSAAKDNPFYDARRPDGVRSKVWSYGFRNPYRIAMHPQLQVPYVGNAGYRIYETVARAESGANLGWPCFESSIDIDDYKSSYACELVKRDSITPVVYDYGHDGGAASVIGGDFLVPGNFPATFHDTYFFADFVHHYLAYLVLDAKGNTVIQKKFSDDIGSLTDISFAPNGALYLLEYGRGDLLRLSHTAAPLRPLSDFQTAAEGLRVLPTSRADALEPVDVSPVSKLSSRVAVPQIAVPAAHSVFAPGQTVTVRAAAKSDANTATKWEVAAVTGPTRRVLAQGLGDTISFVMPAPAPLSTPTQMFASSHVSVRLLDNAGVLLDERILHPQEADGYIRNWWLIGGFYNRILSDDLLPGGDANFTLPNAELQKQTEARIEDKIPVRVRRMYSASRRIDLAQALLPPEHNSTYAFTWIYAPDDRDALLGLHSDDGIAVWLNGKEIWRNKVSRFVPYDTRDVDLPAVKLKKGWNALLVKVNQNVGDWAFKARVLHPNGAVMRDISIALDPEK